MKHQPRDIFDVEGLLELLPIEGRERLARHFTKSALRRCRKDERDALYRNLAQTYTGDSGGELASARAG